MLCVLGKRNDNKYENHQEIKEELLKKPMRSCAQWFAKSSGISVYWKLSARICLLYRQQFIDRSNVVSVQSLPSHRV